MAPRYRNSPLPIPDQVTNAVESLEIARIWIADQKQVVVLSQHQWPNPAAWGLMLADLARHVAASYAQSGHDTDSVLRAIKSAFDAEWYHPTQ